MEKIKPEKAAEMLREKGVEVTAVQAEQVLELLRKFAGIAVAQFLTELVKK